MAKTVGSHHKKYGFLSNSIYHWKEMFIREPFTAAGIFILTAAGLALPLLHAALPRTLLQGLEQHWEMGLFLRRFFLLALCIIIGEMVRSGMQIQIKRTQGPFEDEYNFRMLKKRLLVDYEILESTRFNEEAHSVFDSLYRRNAEMKETAMIWQRCLMAAAGLGVYGLILAGQSVLLLCLVVFPTLITFGLRGRARRKDAGLRGLAEEAARKMVYVEEKATDFKAGKDIRLFGLEGWLMDILKREEKKSGGYVRQWENGYMAVNLFDAALCFLRDACAYLFLIVQIVQGNLTAADFVWYMAVVANCQQSCSTLLEAGERLGRLDLDYERLRSFLDADNGKAFRGRVAEKPEGPVEVCFDHVSYTYPGSDTPTLRDVSFTIRPGEKIALVGLNGAGKTTLVKLLCGLYSPDAEREGGAYFSGSMKGNGGARPADGEKGSGSAKSGGSVRVNGIPVGDYDKETYFSMVSAVFQNVKLLPLSIACNVAPSEGEKADRERIRRCLELTGLLPLVDSLPKKEDTSLGKGVVEGGIELSGGEAQKLWMARALYKDAPLMILDEPTAALDPLAEQEIYEQYVRMAEGKTSLFISHRLASTRFCDRIFLLENGRITESGSHEELLQLGGSYAKLFAVQSQYYVEQTEEGACSE